jgi:type I restriction enzyme M protein
MLFQLNALSKMRPFVNGQGGGRIGLVHPSSPLFTGDAGGGECEIRRHILEKDYLDAIVALPTDMFYNTNIATYLWFMTNRKPAERKGKVLLIDASAMGVVMKKNLGKKRFELSKDCQTRIVRAYHDFRAMEWQDTQAIAGRTRALKAKVFPTSHFFYRKVTIERPLRMRFEMTPERVASFAMTAGVKKLNDGGALIASVHETIRESKRATYMSAEDFRAALNSANKSLAEAEGREVVRLKAKQLELARKHFGTKDKSAQPVTNEKGEVLPDVALRDAEYIPFSVLDKAENVMQGVQAYFDTEVRPHWKDAWINTEAKDSADGKTGLVGCEISFSREFFVYQEPRGRDAILKDLESMEQRFMEMLRGVVV